MFCPKCGDAVPDGAKFCPKCGNAVKKSGPAPVSPKAGQGKTPPGNASGQPPRQGKGGRLAQEDGVCPDCGSRNCEVQVQQNVTGSGKNYSCCNGGLGLLLTGPFGLLCGLCGTGSKTSTTHRSMWVCKDCGNQFPARQDLVANLTGLIAVYCLFIPIAAVWPVLFMSMPPLALIFLAPPALLAFLAWKTYRDYLGDCSLKQAVAEGFLTEPQRKRLLSWCLGCLAAGTAVCAVLLVIL